MKRLLLLSIVVCFSACNDNQPVAQPGDSIPNSRVGQDSSTMQSNSDNAVKPPIDSETLLVENLGNLTAMAQQQEQENQFEQAAETWGQIEEQLIGTYGAVSWQVANAAVARKIALAESRFLQPEMEMLARVRKLQTEFAGALQKNNHPVAKQLAQQIYDLQSELFGADSAVAARQLIRLAELQNKTDAQIEAVSNFHQAITILKSELCEVHPDLEKAHGLLGQSYLGQDQITPAVMNLKQATRLSGALWGENSMDYARRANELGVAYRQSGQLDGAEKILKASEAIRRRELGEDHPQVGHSLLNLGIVFMDQKKYQLAEQNLLRAIKIFDADESMKLVAAPNAKSKLAMVYMLTDQVPQAEEMLLSVVQSARQRGDSAIEVADHQYKYCVALCRQGKYVVAEPILKDIIFVQQKNLRPGDSRTLNSLRAYAMLLDRTGRKNEAQKLQQEIKRVASSQSNPIH